MFLIVLYFAVKIFIVSEIHHKAKTLGRFLKERLFVSYDRLMLNRGKDPYLI